MDRLTRARHLVERLARYRRAWILLAIVAGPRAVGSGRCLPASADGGGSHGVAARDFRAAGLVETFTRASDDTYPPVHLVVFGVSTAPAQR